jgi:hypothetical protein
MPTETADPAEVEQFLRNLQASVDIVDGDLSVVAPMGELTAAYAVGWTARKLRMLKRDPEFLAMMEEAQALVLESVEQMAYRNALLGRQRAIEMILFCKGAHRGWRPPAQRHEVNHSGTIDHSVVAAGMEIAKAMLEESSVKELQSAVIDAEVIDDDVVD